MIPYDAITAWSVTHPWATREQVEQDLLLSKAICDIFNNEMLSRELVFRGGTALNKLILKEPYRYSEDLDFVRTNAGGIGEIMKSLTNIGKATGYRVTTKIGMYPKLYWHTTSQAGLSIRIKIEINTQERISALPLTDVKHSVQSSWFTGDKDCALTEDMILKLLKSNPRATQVEIAESIGITRRGFHDATGWWIGASEMTQNAT